MFGMCFQVVFQLDLAVIAYAHHQGFMGNECGIECVVIQQFFIERRELCIVQFMPEIAVEKVDMLVLVLHGSVSYQVLFVIISFHEFLKLFEALVFLGFHGIRVVVIQFTRNGLHVESFEIK